MRIRAGTSKLPAVILTAVLVNVLMFTVIEWMVGLNRIRLTDTTDIEIANFIRMTERSREVRSRRDPKAPEKPPREMQQDLERLSRASQMGGLTGLSVDLPDIDVDVDLGGNIHIARELTPLVRIPPEYPMAARAKAIEGYVLLRFTVTESGSVADPEVLRSDPPGVFDRAARRAVLKWKYQPQLVDGRPVSVKTYTRLRFELLKEE